MFLQGLEMSVQLHCSGQSMPNSSSEKSREKNEIVFFCHPAGVAGSSSELTGCTLFVLKKEGLHVFAVVMQLAVTHPCSLKSVYATVGILY